jgi:diguanylate cyclase (GGDEF)-like protein/PAS domain S-box-containing protein
MSSHPSGHPRNDAELCELVLTLLDHLDAMVAYWDANQVCVFANNAYREWFGKSKSEVIGLTMKQLLGPLYHRNLPYIEAALGGNRQVFEREIPGPDGIVRHSLATYTPHIVDGAVRGIVVLVANVTPLKALEQELKEAKDRAEYLARHDFLTGLPNRALLFERIPADVARAERHGHLVVAINVDVDDFKRINDVHGHLEGDRLLVEIATRMQAEVRESATVSRWGGDEFMVVVPDIASVAEAETLAHRMLDRLRQPCRLADATVSPTFSLGIALYPIDGTTPDELIASSDRAMYAAKRLGKNRYAFASGPRDE